MLPGLLSCLFRWVIAHVDVPGEVGPDSGCRTGVYAFEVGEQVRTQPVNLAAGFQRLELRAAVERLAGVKRVPRSSQNLAREVL